MEQALIDLAKSEGLWALLFVSLFLYNLSESKKRERKYQEVIVKNQGIIEKLATIINVEIDSLKKTVCDFMRGKAG